MSASTLRTAFIVVGGLAIFFGWGLTGGFEFLMNRDSGSDRPRVEAAPRVLSATECDRLDEDWKSARFAAAALDEIVQSEHSQGRRGWGRVGRAEQGRC